MAAPWIQLSHGHVFDYRTFTSGDIHAVDIARALGSKCRYGGYTRAHYSVAEHCLHLTRHAMAEGQNIHMALWALLHDAGEAYLPDVPGPLKDTNVMEPVRDLEQRILEAIAQRFDLRDPLNDVLVSRSIPDWVGAVDASILYDEATQVLDDLPVDDWHLRFSPGIGATIQFLDRDDATLVYFQVLTDLLRMREEQR